MVVRQGEIWWADLQAAEGGTAAFPRPVVVVQDDAFNRTEIATCLCIPLTSHADRGRAVGNVTLSASETGLAKDSVALVPLMLAVDRQDFRERAGAVEETVLHVLLQALDVVLGR